MLANPLCAQCSRTTTSPGPGRKLGLLGTLLLCAGQAAGARGGAERTSMAATVLGVGLGLVAATTYAPGRPTG
ncbi:MULTISPECIES: hypothetical protein [Streptomyces violaceusniger group]|uniref:Uncharacterized protein n=2 Tax=Streptomyces rhizosphaericus TaxID=114699 RepID=A0ABP4CLS0_9ACTN|nr:MULTISPECIES: hypothetical protein [Streptomyces violaceusniger group]